MAAQEKRKEFCAILGVGEQASKEEIKRAYKQLALQCHPDKNQLNPEATREFQKISEAYTGLCEEGGMDSADEDDINDFDGGVSLLELLQLFFSMSRRKPFFMRSPASWFGGHYSEDSDEVNDSDDACGPVRQNIRNHAGQQAWNDNNHFVPGNARPQSSTKDAGKTGKAKKRKNRRGGGGANSSQNNNQSTGRHGTAGASTSTTSAGGNTSASANAGSRTSTLDQDRAATEATSENQLPGRAGINDDGSNQDCANDAKDGIFPEPSTNNNNSWENSERRGSNGSLRGTAPPNSQSGQQAAEKKPNKKKLQAEQRIREKEYAEIHRAVLEKNRKEEEKRKQKAERERAKLDTDFTPPKLNATARDENKIVVVNDRLPEVDVDPSSERQNECHGTSTEMNDAKDPESSSDTASLDSDARFVKRIDGGHSLESSETIDSLGIEATSDNGQPEDDIKPPAATSFDEQRFDENPPDIGCNGENTVVPNHGERQKFTRVFYGHSSKNQSKNNRFGHNFDNPDGGNAVGGHFPPQRGGYRGRSDNPNYRPHASNSGFVDRSFYRGFHYNAERDGPPNGDDRSGCASEEAGFKDGMGRGSRGQYARGRGNRMRYQNTRFRNASDVHIDPSKSADHDEPGGLGLDRGNGVVDLDVKPSGTGVSLDSTLNCVPNSEFESRRGTDELNANEGVPLPCNGHKGGGGGYAPDNYETSRRGYWPRSDRNFKGQRGGNFRGGFDGGGGGRFDVDQNHPSGGFRSKPVQECWDPEGSQSGNGGSHVDRSSAEMPTVVVERGRGQHRGRRPDRGGFQRGGRGGRGRGFNSSNSHEHWDAAGSGTGNLVDEVDGANETPVQETSNESYRGTRADRGQFQRDGSGGFGGSGFGGRGRGNRGGFRDRTTGETQPRGGNRPTDWEPEKRRFDRGSAALNYDYGEYNGATMQFHRRKQAPGEAVQAPFAATNASAAQNQSHAESASASDGNGWIRRLSEGHPGVDSGPRNVWKDRQEFYEGALPRSKEEEDDMLRAALQLSELEIEERRLSEQVSNMSFTSGSVAGCPSETGWTADVLDVVTVDPPLPPHRQRPADNAAVTDDAHVRLQSQDNQAEGDGRKTGEASVEPLVEPLDDVEILVAPYERLKSWADEMEETNDPGGNGDAYPGDSIAGLHADSVRRSPHHRGGVTPNSWALMNFGAPSDADRSDEARNLSANHSERGNTVVQPTAPVVSPLSAMQLSRAVLDGVLRLNNVPGDWEHVTVARENLQRRPSMLDDIDDGVDVREKPRNVDPPDGSQGADDDHGFHIPQFPQIARHLPEAGNHTGFSAENDRGETVVNLPQSPGLPCPAFPPGPMQPMPWMQPGCPTYFFAVPGYPPWYPMPPYQHYWPCMPSGAPAAMPGSVMPGGVMPMVSQSLGLAHSSSNLADQPPMVSQDHHPMPLPLQQGHHPSAVPGLPPSMPAMLHPIPFGYPHPHHPGHMAPHPAMHVPFAPYPMLPSSAETVDPTARLQDNGLPTNYMDESKRFA